MNTTWKEQLKKSFEKGDFWKNVTHTMTKEQLNAKFDDGYGGSEGCAFTAWSENYVYFPVVYDGSEWVGSVPRNPNGVATSHHGGQ